MGVSPRDYLDFIFHFNKIQNEKKIELINQQNHLMSGIKKIINTEAEVESIRHELTKKDKEIKLKQEEQNIKLDEIHEKKTESEKLKRDNIDTFEKVKESETVIKQNLLEADEALAEAKPALEMARECLNIIETKSKEIKILT